MQQHIRVRQQNPKRRGPDSRKRYERYKSATTVGEYLQLCGPKFGRKDLNFDRRHGFVTLVSANAGAAAAHAASASEWARSAAVTAAVMAGRTAEALVQRLARGASAEEKSSGWMRAPAGLSRTHDRIREQQLKQAAVKAYAHSVRELREWEEAE